jgi:hypothetical protein
MLAHQGEELLIPALIVFAVLAVTSIRRRAKRSYEEGQASAGGGPAASEGGSPGEIPAGCSYCGAALEEGSERCAACGFRVNR